MNKRNTALLLVSAFWLTFFVIGVFAQSGTASAVSLFQGPNASGQQQEVPPGTYLVAARTMGAAAGKAGGMSVRVPAGLTVRFCENQGTNKEGGGTCEEFGVGTHDLRSETPVAYIRVWKNTRTALPAAAATPAKPPVIVFEALNWGGRSQAYDPGMYRSIKGEFGHINDNMAMSAIVDKGFRVRFCEYEGIYLRGDTNCEVHDEGRFNLRLSDSISFIEVIDLNDHSPKDETMPVILFEDPAETGKMQGFDVGTFASGRGQFGKLGSGGASSVTVKKSFRAQVCTEEPTGDGPADNCEEFGPGKFNLRKKHSAVYLKVSKADK